MIRVLHFVDSLAPGGAERVALNLFNELNNAGHMAWLCTSRAEGLLRDKVGQTDRYLFLGKKSVLDLKALFRLIRWVRQEKIELVHAHSSSIYWGVLVKWATGCKLVWHDHAGERAHLSFLTIRLLKCCSLFMDGVFSVNQYLAEWSARHLWVAPQKIRQLPHFAILNKVTKAPPGDVLNILCLANLRSQKNHFNLLKALQILSDTQPNARWEVYLVGEAVDETYRQTLVEAVAQAGKQERVHFIGPQANVENWLSTCSIGVLSSRSEGLPVALLEYGMAGMAVVCTDVGACSTVLEGGKHGLLVPSDDSTALATALARLIRDAELREQLGSSLQAHIRQYYSIEAALDKLTTAYNEILH